MKLPITGEMIKTRGFKVAKMAKKRALYFGSSILSLAMASEISEHPSPIPS